MTGKGERQSGLGRDRLAAAALQLVKLNGLEGLSMRALAEELEVKAASLYWHVRDRRDLLELVADAILDSVPVRRSGAGWREAVIESAGALSRHMADQRDAARILLEVPDAFERSALFADVKRELQAAGLFPAEAAEIALMVMVHVASARTPAEAGGMREGAAASIAIDSGSRGVVLRAGAGMETLVRAAQDRSGVAPGIVRGETVIVRRLRGGGVGEIELDPRRPWRFKVQAPTWNTVIDARGLDVRQIHVDSGATRLECFLPSPRGVVPIHISSGVVDVAIHRPRGAAMTAVVHTGAVRVRLDDYSAKVVVADVHWETPGASGAGDRYELDISSGAVKVNADDSATPAKMQEPSPPPAPLGEPATALDILLDGVAARVSSRR